MLEGKGVLLVHISVCFTNCLALGMVISRFMCSSYLSSFFAFLCDGFTVSHHSPASATSHMGNTAANKALGSLSAFPTTGEGLAFALDPKVN